jgi:hypothetical protein
MRIGQHDYLTLETNYDPVTCLPSTRMQIKSWRIKSFCTLESHFPMPYLGHFEDNFPNKMVVLAKKAANSHQEAETKNESRLHRKQTHSLPFSSIVAAKDNHIKFYSCG